MPSEPPTPAAFAAAGLWPGAGRGLAVALDAGGIASSADVTAQRLAQLDGVGPVRAGRLAAAFAGAAPAWDCFRLLVGAGAPGRLAAGAVEKFGAGAAEAL